LAYVVLLALGALDAAGYGIIAPVAPEISERTGAGPGVIGVLVTCFALGQLLGYPLAGALVRRRHATAVLAVSLALVALGDLGFVLGDGLAAWFPARAVMGVGAGGLWIGVVFGLMERYPGQEYRRLTGLLGAYAIGGIAGPALGAVGGIPGPFLLHLGLALAAGLALLWIGAPRERPRFESDAAVLRSPGFLLASTGVLLIALSLGTLEGALPLHFGELMSQREIAGLFVAASLVVGAASVGAGWAPPRAALAVSVVLLPAGLGLAGAADQVWIWIFAVLVVALGFGVGEAGALGILLESVGVARIVLAMVVWSQAWAIGYLIGPAAAGGVAEALGFEAVGIVPLAAAAAVGFSFLWVPRSTRASR
jgi:MFS family permease